MTSTTSAVSLRDVTKTFKSPGGSTVSAVNGLNLTVEPGEIVAFLGPNGAGKTTSLDILLGLTEPTSGSVEVYGHSPHRAISSGRISAVLQTGGLLRDLSVRETIVMIASTFPTHTSVETVIERADLTKIADRKVSKCSGGEQQRLRYALALLPDPDLIVLDEPTAGMDVGARQHFWERMHADADAGRTVIFATHYLEEADDFATRIVMVTDGRVVADGRTDHIRSQATGRTITVSFDNAEAGIVQLEGLPEVLATEVLNNRVTVHVSDSDAVARALLNDLGGYDLEVESGSLEAAFLQITGTATGSAKTDGTEAT